MPYDRILELTTVPGYTNVHALGIYAKRLTVYSQQTRAINLVDAIHWYRRPMRELDVAIVGAGAAGLTAAARAMELGARITLIERLQQVLEIQNKSDRWLHPTLFEWPARGLDSAEQTTNLPAMNWTAGTAQSVAETLAREWRTRARTNDVVEYFNSQVVGIEVVSDTARAKLHWRHKTKEVEEDKSGDFDVVILAVGFGLEPKGPNRRSYWENDSLNKTLRENESVLIAGYGDGALTDLMRASLNDFDHQTLLTSIVAAVRDGDLARVKEIESHRSARSAEYLSREYRSLDLPAVKSILKPKINGTRKVFLTGRGPNLFEPGASALNRLITSQLLQLGAFTHVPIGDRDTIQTADRNDPVFMRVQGEAGDPFTDVVLRFGVERTITRIDGLPGAEKLRLDWEKVLPNDDPSRARLWDLVKPISEDIDHSCILFVAPTSAEGFVKDVVESAVDDIRDLGIRDLRIVRLTDCLSSDEALIHTVRALCRAPVAIFPFGEQLGRKNLGSMLFLGIRAAVRRGPTLVVQEGSLTAAHWRSLPFNLKEMQLYPLDKSRRRESAARLAIAIKEGLKVLGSDAQGYRDTPVFDIVRRPAPRTENPPPEERTLFMLCSFADSYEESWQTLTLWLDGKDDSKGGKFSLKRVIDYSTPLLAGERLYELTRHAGTCVVDWTDWSSNVFFEMGVRLAVAATPPVCLLRYSGNELDEVARQLAERFKPLEYLKPDQQAESFRKLFINRLNELKVDARSVYAAAERNLIVDDEYGGRPVHEQLFSTVHAMLGSDLANLKLLYGRNQRLRKQVLQSSEDALLAAKLLVDYKLREKGRGTGGALPDALEPELRPDETDLNEYQRHIESLLLEVQELKKSPK
jgi:hypothetical protein